MTENINSSKDLYQALWNSADILRSKMDANDYKSYLLGLIFYKYLSDKLLFHVAEMMGEPSDNLSEALELYRSLYNDDSNKEAMIEVLMREVSYVMEPDLTFIALVAQIHEETFQLESLAQGFRNIEQADELFENLFEDIDLYSKKLGATPQKQNQTIASVMKALANIDIDSYIGDMLGDAYEYLIGQFATDSGKKAGEFYTPQPVAKLMTQIALLGREDKKDFTLYDPTMGSGSLLLNAKKYSHHPTTISYFGQELNTTTYNFARMNMILHGVPVGHHLLSNADTLDEDWPTQEPTNFDAVLMNPPYSAKWSASDGFKQDPRFSPFGALAPKSKADFAFLLHGYYHLKQDGGIMAIVLPHGVLFRGNAEGKIRKHLLEEGAIDTVIGLPANIFFNTSIPTTVIILKKNRTMRDVYFIDASKEFDKGKNQNIMTDEHLDKILEAYKSREDIDKFAHLATFEEIKENDFNLNIPRYVDTFEEEEVTPLAEIVANINQTNANIEQQNKDLMTMLGQLKGTTPEAQTELENFLKEFKL
ncbi:type I restriction-modification system subunit M [Streptococcus zalophi]|uniref:site-specific DNA-methyltransferase (adenine-specific) n=1 Tax=Streptococcus zalophi TaxID=640031 RepID=A0A934UDU8_9STRE|nr:type I restriction-modification system subunit M [Streptococcus zalophi]MBJ8350191.1 type I restriction-modification system subunit M [Streptococcus zalophi]